MYCVSGLCSAPSTPRRLRCSRTCGDNGGGSPPPTSPPPPSLSPPLPPPLSRASALHVEPSTESVCMRLVVPFEKMSETGSHMEGSPSAAWPGCSAAAVGYEKRRSASVNRRAAVVSSSNREVLTTSGSRSVSWSHRAVALRNRTGAPTAAASFRALSRRAWLDASATAQIRSGSWRRPASSSPVPTHSRA